MLSSFFSADLEQINQLHDALNQTNTQTVQGQIISWAHQASTNTSLAEIQWLVLTANELWQKHSFGGDDTVATNQPRILPNQVLSTQWFGSASLQTSNGERLIIVPVVRYYIATSSMGR